MCNLNKKCEKYYPKPEDATGYQNATRVLDIPADVYALAMDRISNKQFKYGQCTMSVLKPTTNFGPPQLSVNGHKCLATYWVLGYNQKFPCHYLWQVSHLCGNPMCINPDHIGWETAVQNVDREACQRQRNFDPRNCNHNPKCIGYTDRAEAWRAIDAKRQELGVKSPEQEVKRLKNARQYKRRRLSLTTELREENRNLKMRILDLEERCDRLLHLYEVCKNQFYINR